MPRKKLTNKQKAYMVEYNKNNTRRIAFTLNYNTEKDLIDYLESIPNKNAYLKALIKADIEKNRVE